MYTTFHLRHGAEAAALLGVPPHVTQVALITVAYTFGTDFKPVVRAQVETIVSWNHWEA